MAEKKKAKEVTDPNEAFARLGYSGAVTDPEGNPVTTEPEQQVQPSEPAQPQPQADTSESAIEFDEEPEQEQEQPKQEQQVPPEEQQRRSWQAEADRAKAEAQKAQEQIRLLQAQNQQLMGVVTPFMQKYGMQPQAQTPQQNGEVEPEPDFIEDGYFEPKKFADYMKKRDAWMENRLENRVTTNWQKRQEQESLQQQLSAVAQEFPEYVNPLTGQVDVERLERDLKSYTSKKTIVDLMREAKGIKPKGDDPLKQSLSAIERNADRPQSAAATAEAPEKEKKPVPKQLKVLRDKFGDLELPPNFDGLVD